MTDFIFLMLVFSQTTAVVETDEIVTTCEPPNNGAGPFWCYGSPLIVRYKDDVFVSAMETGKDIPPLCNTRWRIFRKHKNDNWQVMQVSENFNQREPCPIAIFSDGRLFLSVNPSTQPVGTQYGECDPHLLEFSVKEPNKISKKIHPVWDGEFLFTDHSYRGIAVDGDRGEILLLNIHARSGEQLYSYCNSDGKWIKSGRIEFPIRSCYPQVALKNKSAHVLAIGDIVEPVEEWRQYKFEKTKSGWDYVFRRLFYTWTPDITKKDFSKTIEVDNLEATSGHINNLDLWIDNEGQAHLLYRKQTVQSDFMRDKFFPDTPINVSLEYVIIKNGEIIKKRTLLKGGEGESGVIPGYARFHIAKDNRLFVIYYCSGIDENGTQISENRLLQITPDENNKAIKIPFEKPFGMFFSAIERGGTAPSDTIDLYGQGNGTELRYARIRIQ
ncbi:TPA: hypothetical protein ENS27_17430 [bacterium]|nr:hypothetical protein [bacterium]